MEQPPLHPPPPPQAGGWLVLEVSGLGLSLAWDLRDFLIITAEGPLWNRTAGLCGSLSGNPYDDFSLAEGGVGQGVASWVDSWTEETGQCDAGQSGHPCTQGSAEADQATAFCRILLSRSWQT